MVYKRLMTGPKGNSEFCFPETFNVAQGEVEGNTAVTRKQNSLFAMGLVIKCFVIPPNSNIGKTAKMLFASSWQTHQICRGFKVHDLTTCESKVQVVVSLGS